MGMLVCQVVQGCVTQLIAWQRQYLFYPVDVPGSCLIYKTLTVVQFLPQLLLQVNDTRRWGIEDADVRKGKTEANGRGMEVEGGGGGTPPTER